MKLANVALSVLSVGLCAAAVACSSGSGGGDDSTGDDAGGSSGSGSGSSGGSSGGGSGSSSGGGSGSGSGSSSGSGSGADAGSPGDAASDAHGGGDARGGRDSGTTPVDSGGGAVDSGGGSPGDAGSPNATKECTAVAAGDYETYGLPPVTSLASGLTSEVDWATIPASGGWNGLQIMDACRMKADGFQTWHGRTATRVEVDPGDDPLALGENTERSESYSFENTSGTAIVESGDQFYGISYYFPATWGGTQYPWHVFESGGSSWPGNVSSDCSSGSGNDCNSWSYVAQFHASGPPWGFLQAASTAPGSPQQYAFLTTSKNYAFSDGGNITFGKWTDFVLELNWSSGAINIWRRDEGGSAFSQVVSVVDSTVSQQTGVYFKQGLYRGGAVNGRVDIYWYGPSARGSSFAAVELAAFGTSNGP